VPLRSRLLAWLLAAAVLAPIMSAAGAESSKRRNAAILARVLSYELTLDDRAGKSVGVAVVYKQGEPSSERNANDWFDALNELSSLRIKDKPFFALKIAYSPSDLISAIDTQGIDVLLVADGLAPEVDAVARIARSKHVLSASNDPAHVERDLTVCVVEQDDKLKVIINLQAAQREGIRFSSNLLKVAKLIR